MNALEKAIYNALTGDAALNAIVGGRIYNSLAHATATLPLVIFSLASGTEDNVTPTDSRRLIYAVRCISESLEEAGRASEAIRGALHRKTLSVDGWTNYWSAQVTDIRYREVDPAGRSYWHAGGEFEFRISK